MTSGIHFCNDTLLWWYNVEDYAPFSISLLICTYNFSYSTSVILGGGGALFTSSGSLFSLLVLSLSGGGAAGCEVVSTGVLLLPLSLIFCYVLTATLAHRFTLCVCVDLLPWKQSRGRAFRPSRCDLPPTLFSLQTKDFRRKAFRPANKIS